MQQKKKNLHPSLLSHLSNFTSVVSLTDLLTGIYTVENEKSNGNLKSQNRVIAGLIPLHWLYTDILIHH